MERSTVGCLLRTTQALCSQLCEKWTLEYGIACYSDRFANLPEANQFREVVAERPSEVQDAFDQAEEWFQRRNLTCHRWAPADGQPSDALADFLTDHGFKQRRLIAMSLAKWVEIESSPDIRIVPTRAVRAAYRSTFIQADSPASQSMRELTADAYCERLDDPQYDAFVALVDNKPAGRCTLYQVGDIARVMDLCVMSAFADRKVDATLVAHVLAMAKRLAMRNIVTLLDDDDPRGVEWFEEVGFVCDGEIIEFERSAS
ncbi:MAG: GNAT family N-acetyltransferase [Planctomycetota bacterium]|jgi:hypothetical protein